MEAIDDGLTDIVKFLLEAGADPNMANEVIISLPLPLLFIQFILWGLESHGFLHIRRSANIKLWFV